MPNDVPLSDKLAACRQSDTNRKRPHTLAEFRAYLVADIFHVLERPRMYVDDCNCAPEMLETALWHLCCILAHVDGKQLSYVECSVPYEGLAKSESFANNYRRFHPNATPNEIRDYVASEWRKIVEKLNA